jgi:hypothetical protein
MADSTMEAMRPPLLDELHGRDELPPFMAPICIE